MPTLRDGESARDEEGAAANRAKGSRLIDALRMGRRETRQSGALAEMHERTGNTPVAWEATADSLLTAARVLRSYRDANDSHELKAGDPIPDGWKVGAPELLLRGLAVECMLKAALAKRHALVEKGALIADVRHHDLVRLTDRLTMTLSPKERHLLKRLTKFIEYGGRYPIPVRAEDQRLERVPGGGRAVLTYWMRPSDDELFANLLARIEALPG